MASFAAARSLLRSSPARNAAARFASQSKPKPKASPFGINSTASKPILRRSPVEMSFAVESIDALSYSDCFGFDDFEALHFSLQLWLDESRLDEDREAKME
uniref:Uncharacterized protein n=1 Tax=Salix viminalis TaxID=40686 RepID=A0A6N2K7I0_SALVM